VRGNNHAPIWISGRRSDSSVDCNNGALELPLTLREPLNARFIGRMSSLLASGQQIEQDVYLVNVPFDGRTVIAEATFVPGDELLIGTQLLQQYRLEIHFPDQTVRLEKV